MAGDRDIAFIKKVLLMKNVIGAAIQIGPRGMGDMVRPCGRESRGSAPGTIW